MAADGFGSYRNVMIPFTSGCVVDLTNNGSAISEVFAHVEYASGATPPSLTGGTRNHYHMAHDHAVGIPPYGVHTCLNFSGGPGEIESVVSSFRPADNVPTYLEGDPTFTTDSNNDFYYGGTEDFFGSQWYFQSFQDSAVSDEWGSPNLIAAASEVQAFRFFYGTARYVFNCELECQRCLRPAEWLTWARLISADYAGSRLPCYLLDRQLTLFTSSYFQ